MNKERVTDKTIIRYFAEGFFNDPLYKAYFPNDIDRKRFLKHFMKAYLYMFQETCDLLSLDGAYAIVYYPERPVSRVKAYSKYYLALLKGSPTIGMVGLKKYRTIIRETLLEGSNWLDELDNYHHLDLLVVPDHLKGQGRGKKMIQALQAAASQAGKRLTLETQSSDNQGLYSHLGFETYKVVNRPAYKEYCMIYEVKR